MVQALAAQGGLAAGVAPERLPALVEHNPVIAVEVRPTSLRTAWQEPVPFT